MQQDRNSGLAAVRRLNAMREIDAGLVEAIKRKHSHLIAANFADHPHLASKRGEIMRENGRGASEREPEVAGEKLALKWHLLRKPVEDEVKVDVAGDRYVEALHLGD